MSRAKGKVKKRHAGSDKLKLSKDLKKLGAAFSLLEVRGMTREEWENNMALIFCKGDIAAAARKRGKSYDSLTSSFYRQRSRGEQCKIYLRNLERMEKQLPPNKRKILHVYAPIEYSKDLPRVGA